MQEDTCPRCGSSRLIYEQRDPVLPVFGLLRRQEASPQGSATPLPLHAAPPPRHTYGSWVVCHRCRVEWPEREPDEVRPSEIAQ